MLQQYQDSISTRLCMDAPTLIQGRICNDNRKYTTGSYLSRAAARRDAGATKSPMTAAASAVECTYCGMNGMLPAMSDGYPVMHGTGPDYQRSISYPGLRVPRVPPLHTNLNQHHGAHGLQQVHDDSKHLNLNGDLRSSQTNIRSESNEFLPAHACFTEDPVNESTPPPSITQPSPRIAMESPQVSTRSSRISTRHRRGGKRFSLLATHSRSVDGLDMLSTSTSSPDQGSDSSLEHLDEYGFLPSSASNGHLPFSSLAPYNKTSQGTSQTKSPTLSNKGITRRWRKFKSSSSIKAEDCLWTPCDKGACVWTSARNQRVQLTTTSLLHLTEAERLILRKISHAQLEQLDLGCNINLPKDGSHKRSRRSAFLLKRRSTGSGIWDQLKDKKQCLNHTFGIPLSKCISNDVELQRQCRPSVRRDRKSITELLPPSTPQHTRKSSSSSAGAISCDSLSEPDISPGSDLLDALSLSSSAQLSEQMQQTQRASLKPHTLQVPYIVRACCKHIETYGLQTLGIFRIGCSKKRTKQLREEFDSGRDVILTSEHNPHDVAALLKEFFRDLPDPLLTRELYAAFVATRQLEGSNRLAAVIQLLRLLPPANRDTLWALLNFLHNIQTHSSDSEDSTTGTVIPGNKMDIHNLATLFGPNLLHKAKGGMEYEVETLERADERKDVIKILEELIKNHQQIFTLSAESYDETLRTLQRSNPESVDLLMRRRVAVPFDHQSDMSHDIDGATLTSPALVQTAVKHKSQRTPKISRARTQTAAAAAGAAVSSPGSDHKTCVVTPQQTPKRTQRAVMIPTVHVRPSELSQSSRMSSAGILATPRVQRSKKLHRPAPTEPRVALHDPSSAGNDPQSSGLLTIPSRRTNRNSGSDSLSSASSFYPSSRSTSHSPTSPDSSYATQWSDSSSQQSPERATIDVATSSTQRPLAIGSRNIKHASIRRQSQDETGYHLDRTGYKPDQTGHEPGRTGYETTRAYNPDKTGYNPDRTGYALVGSSDSHGQHQHQQEQHHQEQPLPQWQSERWKHWQHITKQQSEETQEQQTLV